MVTVALESWLFYFKPTRPSRGGFVRLRADATRVPVVLPTESRLPPTCKAAGQSRPVAAMPVASLPVATMPKPMLNIQHARREVSHLAGCGPRFFPVSAFLVSR
jgi:hypothetical protein